MGGPNTPWRRDWEIGEIEAQLAEQHWLSELLILTTRKAWVTQEEIDRVLRVDGDER